MIVPSLPLDVVLLAVAAISVVLFALGVPLVLSFGLWVIAFYFAVPGFSMANVSITAFSELESFTYIAIPLFILVGDLFREADISKDVVAFSRACLGWLPGSTGNTVIGTSAIFSAITGSNAATTASVGQALYPSMKEEGYEPGYASATIAAGGTIGSVLPPSIMLIIYGVTFGVSIPDLFIAGIIPGLAMVVILVGINMYITEKEGYGVDTDAYSFEARNVAETAWRAKIGLGAIVILLGGIFAGIFSPAESASVAVLYILITAFVTGRMRTGHDVVEAGYTSLVLVGVLMPIIVIAVLVQQNLAYLDLQDVVSNAILSLGSDWLVIVALIGVVLIAGLALASIPNVVLTAPLLTPAALEIGLDPVAWGVIFILGDAIGFITPPYGLNLYIISGLTEIDYMIVAYRVLPFLGGLLALLVVLLAVPEVNFLV
ncbi:TRAP transporter large permease [Halalkalicoccus subterraneus]|uniref:TRAP transporter large permease n=1 Tax=Halalkalicoccus subterraneus TaxID=2675002 RepID=UPI000EFDA398|nr:TRAP transporter large permease [Halalkalicoccus subterraneus]